MEQGESQSRDASIDLPVSKAAPKRRRFRPGALPPGESATAPPETQSPSEVRVGPCVQTRQQKREAQVSLVSRAVRTDVVAMAAELYTSVFGEEADDLTAGTWSCLA